MQIRIKAQKLTTGVKDLMPAMQHFLSVVVVVQNRASVLRDIAVDMSHLLKEIVCEYELIFVDNGSLDESVAVLESLTCDDGIPNVQVYALNQEVSEDVATWVGCEQALGDLVAVLDPWRDSLSVLPKMMLKAAEAGDDVVFAQNTAPRAKKASRIYRLASSCFVFIYRQLGGIDLKRRAPKYRLLSRQVINFLMQHPDPSASYRHLPATAGFSRSYMAYHDESLAAEEKNFFESVDQAAKLLVSTTRAPLRIVNSLCLFGALANMIYSVYVVLVATFKSDVAPGWTSMSLQQSGMFMLLSLVMLVLGEYILHVAAQASRAPGHYVRHEYTSSSITSREKLNIDEISASMHNLSLNQRLRNEMDS